MEFTLKRQEIVVPSPPAPPHVVTLSNNDQIMPPFYTGFLYFFPPPSNPPQSASLTQSLARALASFPPTAGRLKPRSNGTGMDIECHNQGALFVEAHSTATLHHLLTTGNGDMQGGMYQPSPLWTPLAPNPYEEEADKPLLFTQLTRLGCGGVVVAVMLHHLVADGAAQAHFVASWAELARGQPITAHPHLDRACMNARTPPCPSFEHLEYTIHQTAPSFSGAAGDELPPMTSRIFEFLPQDTAVLKERASAEADGEDFTGFQALAAHIWKHVTKARGTDAAQEIKMGWAVDGRRRFDPPLPANYFGNVNFYGYANGRAGEVMRDAAVRIRSGTGRVTDDYMRSALDLVAAQASPLVVTASFVGPADLAVTSWAHLKSYDVDWGWGPPLFFAPPVYAFTGLVILLPHRSHGVNALVGLFQPDMDVLLSDAHFYPVQ